MRRQWKTAYRRQSQYSPTKTQPRTFTQTHRHTHTAAHCDNFLALTQLNCSMTVREKKKLRGLDLKRPRKREREPQQTRGVEEGSVAYSLLPFSAYL